MLLNMFQIKNERPCIGSFIMAIIMAILLQLCYNKKQVS